MEKKKLDNVSELYSGPGPKLVTELTKLMSELKFDYYHEKLDSYGLYLYGVVLKRLDLIEEARQALMESVRLEPLHWGAWLELVNLIPDRQRVSTMRILFYSTIF